MPTPRPRVAVILAAGKGTRMKSALPKVLHRAAGRPLLQWVVDAARAAGCARILVVVGHGAERVREEISGDDLGWVLQAEQRGTGHALAQAEAGDPGRGDRARPLRRRAAGPARDARPARHGGRGRAGAPWPSPSSPIPGSLGRVIVDGPAPSSAIVEFKDATPEQRAVRMINAGIYALPAPDVFDYLART